MKGGQRPGAGRKPRPDDKMIRVAISLTPKQYDWLSERPEGMAVTVRYFIEHAIEQDRIAGRSLLLEERGETPWDLLRDAQELSTALKELLIEMLR